MPLFASKILNYVNEPDTRDRYELWLDLWITSLAFVAAKCDDTHWVQTAEDTILHVLITTLVDYYAPPALLLLLLILLAPLCTERDVMDTV